MSITTSYLAPNHWNTSGQQSLTNAGLSKQFLGFGISFRNSIPEKNKRKVTCLCWAIELLAESVFVKQLLGTCRHLWTLICCYCLSKCIIYIYTVTGLLNLNASGIVDLSNAFYSDPTSSKQLLHSTSQAFNRSFHNFTSSRNTQTVHLSSNPIYTLEDQPLPVEPENDGLVQMIFPFQLGDF